MATTAQLVLSQGFLLVGVSQWRAWSPECAAGGTRVSTNIMVRDMDLAVPNPGDSRRIEVLADGLALLGGVQLATDTTLVSLSTQMVQLVQVLRRTMV